ncbi:hypothetical protein NP493_1028g00006 [Ridgeia piscesae]|uniref:Uncharacterized protein n=1 Tax=Ridgeia piscesae TaxID=27915 RepID=A0AAD9KI38_RIDPI|nr:hypothetical protein NP493_1028g00006 [Ridgeia piscesae]
MPAYNVWLGNKWAGGLTGWQAGVERNGSGVELRTLDYVNQGGRAGAPTSFEVMIAQATAALAKLKTIWNDMNIATLTADTERRIQAMEMRCLRKLLGITHRDHIFNEDVRNRTRQATGPHEDLLTTVKRRKLK